MVELDSDPEAAKFWQRVVEWHGQLETNLEFEPDELELLDSKFGASAPQVYINASWRSEALGVLAWALRKVELPPHDVTTTPGDVARAIGFLKAETVLAKPLVRPASELREYREVAFSVHWRLREFSLQREAIDFPTVARRAWFGPLSLTGVALVDNDLSIKGLPIMLADAHDVQRATSIARERHQAINWLVDARLPLSETGTDT